MRSLIVLALIGVTVGCHKFTQSASKSLIPGVTGEGFSLGMGYDSLVRKSTGVQCFDGFTKEQEFKGGTASLEILNDVDRSRLQRIMEGEIELKIPVYPGIRAVGTAAYASEYAKTDYSQNFVVTFQAITERTRAILPVDSSIIKPTAELERISKMDAAVAADLIEEACGDEYVAYWAKGVALAAVLSIEYGNELDLKRFSGTLGADILTLRIPLELRTEYENMKKHSKARAKLIIQQRGGAPEKILGEILKVDDASKNPGFFLQCDAETIEDCTGVFKRVVSYMKQLESQIKSPQGVDLGQGVPLLMETAAYPNEGTFKKIYGTMTESDIEQRKIERAEGTKLISEAREILNVEIGANFADQDRLVTLDRRMGSAIKEQVKGKLSEIKQKIDQYRADLKAVSEECSIKKFDKQKIKACAVMVKEILAKKPYTNEQLKLGPKTFMEWCPLAFDSNNLINEGDFFAILALVEVASGNIRLSNEELIKSCQAFSDKLASLKDVDLSNATYPLSSLNPLSSLPALQTIAARNQILGSVTGLENMEILDLDLTGNQVISLISFTQLKSKVLRQIVLKDNLIETLETGPSALEVSKLDVSGNSIQKMQEFRSGKLSRLVLDGNPIKADGFINSGIAIPSTVVISLRKTGTTICPSSTAFTCEF